MMTRIGIRSRFHFVLLFIVLLQTSCSSPVPPPPPPVGTDDNGRTTETLKTPIKSNTTLKSDIIYILDKPVTVENGATLTIEAGTLIKGSFNNTTKTRGALIIKPGAKIIAEGSVDKPIIFTSNKPKGQRAKGDWAGILILGNAPVNSITNENLTPARTTFGGTNSADNSGILKYVRIEFAGGIDAQTAVSPTKWNALTLAGVGSGTQISHVQITDCDDDAFEFIGGTVNCKYLYSLRNRLIDFKTSFGYSGIVQYAYSHKGNVSPSASAICLQSENDYAGSYNTPITTPTFINCTFVGFNTNVNLSYAVHLKNNTRLALLNSVIIGHNHSLFLDGPETASNAGAGMLEVQGCVVSNWKKDSLITNASFNIENWYKKLDYNNLLIKNLEDLGLPDIYASQPIPLPSDNSPLKSATNIQSLRLVNSLIENANYRGAFHTVDWTQGWTDFSPNDLEY
ncbi:MAG: hypothetical protein KatS3mg035_0247 [Bacteroidia bacterium]|nr:MAG: hypothetical protein KatS3mg035_0247 [Bacteroidia bacterium]